MSKRLFSWLLLLFICFMLGSISLAEGAESDDEEVSLEIFKEEEEDAITDGEEPEVIFDPAAPVYELDGSIVITMSFTGAVTIGTNTQSSQPSLFDSELKKQRGDINFPLRNVKEIFEEDHLTMITFESTLTTANKNTDRLSNDFLFRADPSYAAMLQSNGIDVATLENDHVLDMGEEGLADTKKALQGADIAYAAKDQPAILTRRGLKIGTLTYQVYDQYEELIPEIYEDVQALRDQGCDLVIVSYHWGTELAYSPDDGQVLLGRATIDAGADLVIGNHSGRINPIEYYNGRYICYSLGNFSYAGESKPNDMSTFIFQIKMRVMDGIATSEQIKLIPCRISSRRDYNDFAPTPYDKSEHVEAVLRTLRQNGKDLEYAVTEFPLSWIGEE